MTRRRYADPDELSALSSATPVISNSSRRRKQRKHLQRKDDEEWSNVTPVISNRDRMAESSSPTKKDEIDYGQIVIDARNPSRAVGEYNRVVSPNANSEGPKPSTESRQNSNGSQAQTRTQPQPQLGMDDTIEMERRYRSVENKMFETVGLPFLIALFSTVRFLLSTTSSLSCSFVQVDIGFVPKNVKFASEKINIGPWAYERGKCLSYPEDFTHVFIKGSNSWTAPRIAAIVNIALGFIVFTIAAFVIIYKVLRFWPSSARATTCIKSFDTRWEVIIFFFIILMFIFEVIKFLFWGVNLCTDEVWMTEEYRFVPAQGCSLSTGAQCSLSAVAFDLVVILLLACCSTNLRASLSKICCWCRKKKQKRAGRQPVETNDLDEVQPRIFLEGDDNLSVDDATAVTSQRGNQTSVPQRSKIKSKKKSNRQDNDEQTLLGKSRYKKVDSGDSDSDDASLIPRSDKSTASQKERNAWVTGSDMKKSATRDGEGESGDESIVARGDDSTSSQNHQNAWIAMRSKDTGKGNAQATIEVDSDSDSSSGSDDNSIVSAKKAGANGVSTTNPFDDDTADLLGFNEPSNVERRQVGKSNHIRDDSDDIGFPASLV